MKLGLVISMYDEINQVVQNIENIKKKVDSLIVIQSDPNNQEKILDESIVDHYSILPDIAGTTKEYEKEREKGLSTIPAKAVTRNYSFATKIMKNIDVDWWIFIFGDVSITNMEGIEKILNKITKEKKNIAITRPIGQTFPDENGNFVKIQKSNTTSFMPQFFIVDSSFISKGFLHNIEISNPFCTEQCLGDELTRYCLQHNLKFQEVCYFICDYAYPQFIKGLSYNPDKIRLPRYIDGIVNYIRKILANNIK